MKILFFLSIAVLTVLSFGFVDPNLVLSTHPLYIVLHSPLSLLVYQYRPYMAGIYFMLVCILFFCYIYVFGHAETKAFSRKKVVPMIVVGVFMLIFSYPALSYDLFNYMTTAKVVYTHHENPYLVMPIEIINEPYLAFTRAANKVALYGPIWLLLTYIPHTIGNGSIWGTIIAFKVLNACMYGIFAFLVYVMTKSWKNVLFFALNPLILIEVLISGHNDIYMMVFAVFGLYLWEKKGIGNKTAGIASLFASSLIKGASIVLLPLFFIKNISRDRLLMFAYCLLAAVFFVLAPLREELYPWYAVWLVSIASLLDMQKYRILILFTIVLTFALELRHIPYMWMGYYEGPGPMFRAIFTVVPLGIFALYVLVKKFQRKVV